MNRSPDGPSEYSLGIRKALMIACAVPAIAAFAAVLIHHKGLINVEEFGVPENYLYIGGLGLFLLAFIPLFIVWRCPGCGAYLGREASPTTCRSCGARFS
jgi:hypothetical protein